MNVYLGELYKEVEYIQSSGTQYINTGYIPSNNTKIEMSMGGFNSSTSANALFGARYSWNANASIGRGFQRSVNAAVSPYGYGGMFGRNYSSGTDNFNVFSWGDGGNHILSLDQSGFYQDGVKKYTPDTVTFTSPVNLYIFSNNTNGQISEFAPYKLYYFKIYTSGTLVRDFIPCYRVSDNVIGLFDKVENKFYTNAGTGTFTKGNDVKVFQAELKNAYIGEYKAWEPGVNTLAYYPLTSTTTVNDMSGNSKTLTKGTVTFGTYKGVDCAYFSGSSSWLRCQSFYNRKRICTISVWFYWIANGYTGNGNYDEILIWWDTNGAFVNRLNSPYTNLAMQYGAVRESLTSDSKWRHLVMTYDGNTTGKAYLDGVLKGTNTSFSPSDGTNLSIGTNQSNFNDNYKKWIGGISQVIIEGKVWTDTEIQNYYNQTKSNYGL